MELEARGSQDKSIESAQQREVSGLKVASGGGGKVSF